MKALNEAELVGTVENGLDDAPLGGSTNDLKPPGGEEVEGDASPEGWMRMGGSRRGEKDEPGKWVCWDSSSLTRERNV